MQGERRGNAGRNVRGAWWTREERFHDVTLKEGKMVGKRGASLVTKPQGTGITNSLSVVVKAATVVLDAVVKRRGGGCCVGGGGCEA